MPRLRKLPLEALMEANRDRIACAESDPKTGRIVKVTFFQPQSTQVSTHTAPAPGTDQKQKQVPEPSIPDAELVLNIPKGMLIPVLAAEPYTPDPDQEPN